MSALHSGASWNDQIRWITVQNDYSDKIPAYAAVKVKSVDSQGLFHVTQPDADNQDVMINGPIDIPQNGTGACTRDFPNWVLYYSGDGTPNPGEEWGVKANDFNLRKGFTGFFIDGAAGSGIVLAKKKLTPDIEYDDGSSLLQNLGAFLFSKLDFILTPLQGAMMKIQTRGMTTNAQTVISAVT